MIKRWLEQLRCKHSFKFIKELGFNYISTPWAVLFVDELYQCESCEKQEIRESAR